MITIIYSTHKDQEYNKIFSDNKPTNEEYYQLVIDYGKALNINNFSYYNTLNRNNSHLMASLLIPAEIKLISDNAMIKALFFYRDYIYYFLDDENYPKYFKEFFDEINDANRSLFLNIFKKIKYFSQGQSLDDVVYKWRILYRRLSNKPINELNYEELSSKDNKLIEKYETAINKQNQKQTYYENLDKKHAKEMNEFYLTIL